mmetsp:Transcript_27037/g.88408  ORF Transcript_27037/g.88408 Transcript_27037/m.88408 type:complete len:202 (-) Transcript_27037:1027-1632(-)
MLSPCALLAFCPLHLQSALILLLLDFLLHLLFQPSYLCVLFLHLHPRLLLHLLGSDRLSRKFALCFSRPLELLVQLRGGDVELLLQALELKFVLGEVCFSSRAGRLKLSDPLLLEPQVCKQDFQLLNAMQGGGKQLSLDPIRRYEHLIRLPPDSASSNFCLTHRCSRLNQLGLQSLSSALLCMAVNFILRDMLSYLAQSLL